MNKNDIAYAAGLFDAEGSVSIGKWKCKSFSLSHSLDVCVTSGSQSTLNWLRNNFIGGYISPDKRRKNDCFRWRTSSNVATNFLRKIAPCLQIKKLQAELAFQFQDEIIKNHRRDRLTPEILQFREQFRNQMLALNKKFLGVKLVEKPQIAYFAGLFDGDGSILINEHPYHQLQISLGLMNQLIINQLKHNFGGSASLEKYQRRDHLSLFFRWKISADLAINFLQNVFPFLRIIKPQAELAFQFRRVKKQNRGRRLAAEVLKEREQFRKQMVILNHSAPK